MTPLLQQLRSSNLNTRIRAATMLKEQLDNFAVWEAEIPAIVDALMELVARESDDTCRATALMTLCSCASAVPVERIAGMLDRFAKFSLIEALCLIGEAGDLTYRSTIARYLEHADPDVCTSAAEAYAVLESK